ncbi:hypothetical protein L6Q96_21525 [Candidatus Binatia bacterium]|nr:hypothetical protein [Candidatus Binatia bacterium]
MRRAVAAYPTVAVWAVWIATSLLGHSARGEVLFPLTTEDARPLPSGIGAATIGAAYYHNLLFPYFTPPGLIERQDLVAIPDLSFRIGAGDWVELQAGFPLLYLDERGVSGQTNRQYGPGDASLFTKVRILKAAPHRPALAVRFGAQLPNGIRADRLGTDEMNFIGDLLASYAIGPVWTHVNLGMALVTIPEPEPYDTFTSEGQDDLFVYRVAAVSPWWGKVEAEATRVRLLGEVAGSAGSRFDNDRADVRAGLQIQWSQAMLFAGLSTGIVEESETIGAFAGFTYFIDFKALWHED